MKEIKTVPRSSGTHPHRRWLLGGILLLLLACFATTASAASLREENLALCTKRSTELTGQLESYRTMDDSVGQQISGSVTSAVVKYQKQLLDLQTHPELSTRSLESEIDLAFWRGTTAGKLTWIYVTNAASASGETESRSFLAAYEALMTELDGDSLLSDSSPDSYACRLNVAIYSERIRSLAEDGDSRTTSAILAGAVARVRAMTSGELSGESYQAVWEQARTDAAAQRHRDALYGDFCHFYESIAPAASAEADEITSLLFHCLSHDTTLSQMNTSLKEAAFSLLDRYATGTHRTAYILTVKEKVSREIASASANGRRACISPLGDGFSHAYAVSEAKDELTLTAQNSGLLPSETLTALVSEYVADRGIFDRCTTAEALSFELWRASLRIDWLRETEMAKGTVSQILSGFDAQELLQQADALRTATDLRILGVTATDEAAKTLCTAIVAEGTAGLAALSLDAHAEQFRLTHVSAIETAPSALTVSHRAVLTAALEDWELLSTEVKNRLTEEAAKLKENYRRMIRLLIAASVRSDEAEAYRSMEADKLYVSLSALSHADLTAFRKAADSILMRSDTIAALLDAYGQILQKTDYSQYAEARKNALRLATEAGCLAIQSCTSEGETLQEELATLLSDRLLELTRQDAIARIYLAAEGTETDEITGAIRIAETQILAAVSEDTVLSLAKSCILTVRKTVLRDKADGLALTAEQALSTLTYLSDTDRSLYLTRLQEKIGTAKSALLSAAETPTAELAYATLTLEWEEIWKEATAADLLLCKTDAALRLETMIAAAKAELAALEDTEESVKQQFATDLETLLTNALASVHLSADTQGVSQLLTKTGEEATALVKDARLYRIRLYRAELLTELEGLFGQSEHYSEAAYARVQAELTAFSLSLEARETSEEYDTLFRTAKARLASIPTLLEDAKTEVSALLQSTYDSLTASSALYSEEALAELTRLAEEAKNAISAVTAVSQHGLVRELADQALAAMKAVKRDRLCNGQSDLSDVGYPAEFDHAVNGYWGTVEKADAIPSGSSLTITECPKNSEDLYNKLSVAMKRDLLLNAQGEPVSASLGRKLKKGELLLALDIRTDLPSASLPYRVTILLPNGFEQETLLGVVCFGAGGSAEFLPCTREGDQLIFETTHFSDFYLVAESDLNLLPAILLVSLLILCELIAVSWLLYRRYRRRKNEDDTEADGEPPLLPFAAVVPFSLFSYPKLLQIKPEHGGSLLIVLSGAALLLGAAIAVLIRQEAEREKRNKQNAIEKQKAAHSGKKERHALPNRHTAALPPRRADEFMMRDSTEMVTDTEALRVSAAANIALAEEETLNDELLSTAREGRPPEDLDLPQAGDAALEETDREEEERRYELNVDVLARHFSAGDCVTPELLKKMGVIPSNVTHLKILARGRLTIPLHISAQEFSSAALRMIRKAGGKAYKIR